jgi:hypothetical protein
VTTPMPAVVAKAPTPTKSAWEKEVARPKISAFPIRRSKLPVGSGKFLKNGAISVNMNTLDRGVRVRASYQNGSQACRPKHGTDEPPNFQVSSHVHAGKFVLPLVRPTVINEPRRS